MEPSLPTLIDRHPFQVQRGGNSFGPFRGWFQSVRTMARPFYLVPADADYVLYIRKEALGAFRLRPNDRVYRIDTGEQFIVMGHPEDPSGEGWLFEVYLQFVPAMEG